MIEVMGGPIGDGARSPELTSGIGPERTWMLSRGTAAASVATFVALMSHLIGGGALPGLLGIAVPLLLATSTSIVLAQLRLPWLRLTVSVAVSQGMFHLLFSLGTRVSPVATSGSGHRHHTAGSLAASPDALAQAGHASVSMWLAHAGGAVVTVLALRHGEVAAGRLCSALAQLLRRVPVQRAPVVPVRAHVPPARLEDDRAWVPAARMLTSACVFWRGPPVRTVAAFS